MCHAVWSGNCAETEGLRPFWVHKCQYPQFHSHGPLCSHGRDTSASLYSRCCPCKLHRVSTYTGCGPLRGAATSPFCKPLSMGVTLASFGRAMDLNSGFLISDFPILFLAAVLARNASSRMGVCIVVHRRLCLY